MNRVGALLAASLLLGLYNVAAEETTAENLFKFGYSDMTDGSKPGGGYVISAAGEDSVTVDSKVFAPPKGPSVRLETKKLGDLCFDSPTMSFIEKDKQYLLTIKVKIDDMNTVGHWWEKRCGLWIYVYDTKNNVLTWCNFGGKGSTKGWVTMMLPFEGKRFADGTTKLLIRCRQMSGTIWVQDPTIIELPTGVKMDRSFILEDGSTVTGSHLTVK